MSSIVCGNITDSRVVTDSIRALCRIYPFLHRTVIGKSACGRDIEALSVGHGEQAVLFTAGSRAQEHITCALCLRLCEELCRMHHGDSPSPPDEYMAVLSRRTVVIVPLLNPDGVDIALHGSRVGGSHADLLHAHGADIKGYWQANAVGVDIAVNFDVSRDALQKDQREHGIVGPCGRGFGGSSPESESESASLSSLCRRVPFSHAIHLTCGNDEVRWQFGDRTPPHARMTARFLAHAGELSPAVPSAVYTSGGFCAWFVHQFERPAFDIAVAAHRGTCADELYEKTKNALLLAAVL